MDRFRHRRNVCNDVFYCSSVSKVHERFIPRDLVNISSVSDVVQCACGGGDGAGGSAGGCGCRARLPKTNPVLPRYSLRYKVSDAAPAGQ